MMTEPAAKLKMGFTGRLLYYHVDHLGSVRQITDLAGAVIQAYRYASFGAVNEQLDAAFIQPYSYTGRELDLETGSIHYRARSYCPQTGRFNQGDPFPGILVTPTTLNLYNYVAGNPINFVDPDGLEPKESSGLTRFVDKYFPLRTRLDSVLEANRLSAAGNRSGKEPRCIQEIIARGNERNQLESEALQSLGRAGVSLYRLGKAGKNLTRTGGEGLPFLLQVGKSIKTLLGIVGENRQPEEFTDNK